MRILAILGQRLGDFVQATPLLQGILSRYPGAELRLAFRDPSVGAAAPLFFPGLETVPLGDFAAAGGPPAAALAPDLLVNLSVSPQILDLIPAFRAKETLGPARDGAALRMPPAHSLALAAMAQGRRLGRLNLVDVWRGYLPGSPPALKRPEAGGPRGATAEALQGLSSSPGPLVAVHLGAGGRLRRYPPAAMAKALSVAHGALPLRVILLGSRRERALALSFLAGYRGLAPGAPAVSVAGGTDLPGLLSVLREADLLVSSDTGVAHLGASLGTRLLTLFMGPALCHETAPYSARLLCLQGMAPCGPCVEGPGCREGVCLAAPGPGALAAHVLRALGPCPQGGPDPRPLGGLGSNPLTGSGPAPEASGPALSFESFEGTIAKNAARLIPGGPLGASLNETALTALVFKKAAMAAIFGEDEGEWDPRLDGLGRYRMDGPPPDLDAALGVLRRIARDGLKDKAQRGLFTDHAAGLLYSPDWHAMAGAAPA